MASFGNSAHLTEIKTLFSVFDKNKDGFLTAKEVAALLQSGKLSVSIPYNAVQKIVRGVDQKDKKMVNITQLTELLGQHCSEFNPMGDMLEAFKVFDKNGDGVISVSELRQVMNNLGERLTDRELQRMFQNADQDGDGEINFNEFLKMMMHS
uniref:Calmodulin-A-like n=1 Tax=Crassostrea virginica TaxID=6565 RepID=A0A8B8DV53_CRAVI|nr:calmodulin-A-like [Crassostrea virginica]XP_022331533.1 calmodulin-A-like [Crassostrea virginica]